MGDKGDGGVKNIKKWVTSFMDILTQKVDNCGLFFQLTND